MAVTVGMPQKHQSQSNYYTRSSAGSTFVKKASASGGATAEYRSAPLSVKSSTSSADNTVYGYFSDTETYLKGGYAGIALSSDSDASGLLEFGPGVNSTVTHYKALTQRMISPDTITFEAVPFRVYQLLSSSETYPECMYSADSKVCTLTVPMGRFAGRLPKSYIENANIAVFETNPANSNRDYANTEANKSTSSFYWWKFESGSFFSNAATGGTEVCAESLSIGVYAQRQVLIGAKDSNGRRYGDFHAEIEVATLPDNWHSYMSTDVNAPTGVHSDDLFCVYKRQEEGADPLKLFRVDPVGLTYTRGNMDVAVGQSMWASGQTSVSISTGVDTCTFICERTLGPGTWYICGMAAFQSTGATEGTCNRNLELRIDDAKWFRTRKYVGKHWFGKLNVCGAVSVPYGSTMTASLWMANTRPALTTPVKDCAWLFCTKLA